MYYDFKSSKKLYYTATVIISSNLLIEVIVLNKMFETCLIDINKNDTNALIANTFIMLISACPSIISSRYFYKFVKIYSQKKQDFLNKFEEIVSSDKDIPYKIGRAISLTSLNPGSKEILDKELNKKFEKPIPDLKKFLKYKQVADAILTNNISK